MIPKKNTTVESENKEGAYFEEVHFSYQCVEPVCLSCPCVYGLYIYTQNICSSISFNIYFIPLLNMNIWSRHSSEQSSDSPAIALGSIMKAHNYYWMEQLQVEEKNQKCKNPVAVTSVGGRKGLCLTFRFQVGWSLCKCLHTVRGMPPHCNSGLKDGICIAQQNEAQAKLCSCKLRPQDALHISTCPLASLPLAYRGHTGHLYSSQKKNETHGVEPTDKYISE